MEENKSLKFKDAMNRLSEIVKLLNNNDLELEEAMKLFEEGLMLTRQCEKQLKDFENRMDQLIEVKDMSNE